MIDQDRGIKSFMTRYVVEITFTVLYLAMASILNLQFLEGSNINTVIAGHDEYITVKEVYSILHPLSWKHFFLALIAGDVIFYGRIMFYLDAAFAWLPFRIWGVEGMVYTIRMVHSVFLVAGLLLLAHTFLKSRFHKALFLTGSGAIFYSLYFVMMPKPEPIQLFFLALFLFYFKRKNWSFGWHFILMGIAFGLKFNVLLLLPIVFLIPFLKKGVHAWQEIVIKSLKSFGFFIAGLIIAIPCLLLSPIKPVYLQAYIHEIKAGIGKSYDDLSLTVFDWLQRGFGGYYLGHWIMGFIFMALILLATVLQLRKVRYNNDVSALILLVFGLVMTWSVMFTTKRLWPHYIWTGFIFMLLGLIVFAAQQTSMKQRRVYLAFISMFSLVSFIFFLNRDLPMYANLDKNKEVIRDSAESKMAIDYIRYRYPGAQVVTDGSLLYPFSDFVKAKPYHPFASLLPLPAGTTFNWSGDHPEKIWNHPADIVVFCKRHPERMMREHPNVYAGQHEDLYDLYKRMTKADFVRDTSFGEVIVYGKR